MLCDLQVDGATYDCVMKSAVLIGRVINLEQHARHLTNRREEEFVTALASIAAEEEGVAITDVEVVSPD